MVSAPCVACLDGEEREKRRGKRGGHKRWGGSSSRGATGRPTCLPSFFFSFFLFFFFFLLFFFRERGGKGPIAQRQSTGRYKSRLHPWQGWNANGKRSGTKKVPRGPRRAKQNGGCELKPLAGKDRQAMRQSSRQDGVPRRAPAKHRLSFRKRRSASRAWWRSGLTRKTRNLVPSGAPVRIRPTSGFVFVFFSAFLFCCSALTIRET